MHKFVVFFLSLLGVFAFDIANAQSIPPPNTLIATNASATQINLTWVVNGPNTGFQIERSLTSGSGFTLVATTAANAASYSNTGLMSGTTYFYRVRAIYGSSYSDYTSEASATATNPIYVVPPNTLIATTASTTQINLTWIVNGSNTGFQIERSLTSGGGFTLVATTTANVASYSNTGLTESTIYFYRVRAIYGSNYSGYTSEASATTFANNPPVAPINLTATTISTTQINLTWADNSTNETGFQIERSLTSGSDFTLVTTTVANATSYSNTSLAESTKYFYRVRATNSAGNSAFTSEASATTLSPPAAPSQAQVPSASSSSALVTWQDNSDDETGFQIERSINLSSGYSLIATTSANVTSFTDTGLASGTAYYYRIRAINSIGNSAYTGAAVLTPPAPPSQLVAQALSSSSVKLTWANSNVIASFLIYRSISENAGYALIATTSTNVITFTDIGLAPVTIYYYQISAINASGGASTAIVSAQTFDLNTPPGAPSGLTAQVTSSSPITLNSFITLNWADNSGNETGFEVYRSPGVTGSGMELISTTPANATSFVDERLSEGTNYLYRIRSINTFGNSALSEILIYLPYFNNYNWIKETVVFQKNTLDETQVGNLAIANGQKNVIWNYFDGLGRPMQTVNVASSPSGGDLVQPIIYDNQGRETKKYLPYKSTDSDGWYKPLPVGTNATDYSSSPQAKFYQTGGLVPKDDYPYTEIILEPSPLNRILEQGSPGEAWQPDATNSYTSTDRTAKFSYESNQINEILLLTYTPPDATHMSGEVNAGTSTAPVYYPASSLYKTKTKDENGNEVIEYVDKEGHTVCKKVQYDTDAATSTKLYTSTYYIYDDLGNLVLVLPPEGVKALTSSGN